jgi:hypothetical protein
VLVGNSHQNVEFCFDRAIAPKEILVPLGLQSQGCKLLELIPRICISTVSLLCQEVFFIHPSFGYNGSPHKESKGSCSKTPLGPLETGSKVQFPRTQFGLM